MALVIGGAEYSGKINNKVFLRTGSVRGYAVPTNPASPAQIAMRSLVGTVTTQFRDFTDEEQTEWRHASLNFPRTNRVGSTYYLSGLNFWISCATIAQIGITAGKAVGTPAAGNAPAPLIAPTIMLIGVNVSEGTLEAQFNESLSSGQFVYLFATAGLSPAVNFTRKSDYRLIAVIDASETGDPAVDVTLAYEAIFGARSPGTRIFMEAFSLNANEWVKRPAGKAFGVGTW